MQSLGREEHRGHRGGHFRTGRGLPAEPPASGAAVRERAPAGWPHQYRDRPHAREAWRSTPASSSTTTAPIRTWCGCSRSWAWRLATRTCRSRCRAAAAGSSDSSRGANGFFAQRWNLVRPSHLSLLREILRFNREAPALLQAADAERHTLGDFLESRRFGDAFTHRYLLPMASAIWSASLDAIRSFPAITLIRFLDNHGLLSLNAQPTWKVVAGGSHTYIPQLTAPVSTGIHQGAEVDSVRRTERDVTIAFRDRPAMKFDEVVFACHGDQVLSLLADPNDRERDVLANFTTTANVAWLHTDASVLPLRAPARASWNYRLAGDPTRRRR